MDVDAVNVRWVAISVDGNSDDPDRCTLTVTLSLERDVTWIDA